MKKKITFLLMFVLSLSISSAQNTFRFGTSATPEGKTLLVDSKGLILDGKHIIPVMGEIHYSRVPESEWRREIRKMKAGGINIISTYIFWIHHEPEEGKWNWSGNHNLRRFVRICAEENVMLGGKKDIEKILEAVGIPREDWKRQVLQLSGGQQQRVAIARALASPAKVLLADEPTGNLDEEIADEIIKILMKSAHEMGKSVIVVTHSKKIADAADVVLKIHEGKLYHLV